MEGRSFETFESRERRSLDSGLLFYSRKERTMPLFLGFNSWVHNAKLGFFETHLLKRTRRGLPLHVDSQMKNPRWMLKHLVNMMSGVA